MPIERGTHKPGDLMDIYTMQAVAKEQGFAPPTANEMNLTDLDGSPSAKEVNTLGVRDWPTTFMLKGIANLTDPDDPNYVQPWSTLEPKYYRHEELFKNANSPEQWYRAMQDADREDMDGEMFSDMSLGDWAHYIGLQAVDPATIGLTMATVGLYPALKGMSVGKAAARVGAITAAEATAIEAVLQMTDPLREFDDSLLSIAAGGAFGAFVGSGVQALTRRSGAMANIGRDINLRMREEVDLQRIQNLETDSTTIVEVDGKKVARVRIGDQEFEGSPAEVILQINKHVDGINIAPSNFVLDTTDVDFIPVDMGDETPIKSLMAPLVNNWLLRSDSIRVMYNGVSATWGRLGDMIGASNILKRGDYTGTRYNGKTLREELKKTQRRQYRILSDSGYEAKRALNKRNIRMSLDEIMSRAGKAARREEPDDLPEVQKVADQFRKDMDDWADRAVAQGLLTPETVADMKNYVPRMYDLKKILSPEFNAKFRKMIVDHYRLKNLPLSEEELLAIPTNIIDRLAHAQRNYQASPSSFRAHSDILKSGHFKNRKIDIPEDILEEFLISDVRVLSMRYNRTVGSDVQFREMFGADNIEVIDGVSLPKAQYQQGIQEFEDAANKVIADAAGKGKRAEKRAAKQAAKIREQKDKVSEAVREYIRSVMGRPKHPDKKWKERAADIAQGIRGYESAVALGEVIESAFPDAANNILQHGMLNLLGSLPTFFRTLPVVMSRGPIKGVAANHYREMDVALDMLLNSRMMDVADIEDASLMGIKRGSLHGSEIARKAFRVFLADRWNTGAKLLAAVSSERRIVKDAQKMVSGKLGKHRLAKMHRIGMTPAMAKRITSNMNKHGKKAGLIESSKWDTETQMDFQRMIFRESEFQVVAPDSGEMPTIFDNEIGRMFMQFRTFVMSHTMKHLIPASQRLQMGDLSVMAGLTTMTGLGVFSQYVKDVTRSYDSRKGGFDIDKVNKDWSNKTAMDIIAIGLDRSAVLSYLPGLLGALDNFSENELGISAGMSERKRYFSPGMGLERQIPATQFLGNLTKGFYEAGQAAFDFDDFTAKDLNRFRRSLPMQNTFYLGWLLDWGEDLAADAFNLPEDGSAQSTRFGN